MKQCPQPLVSSSQVGYPRMLIENHSPITLRFMFGSILEIKIKLYAGGQFLVFFTVHKRVFYDLQGFK